MKTTLSIVLGALFVVMGAAPAFAQSMGTYPTWFNSTGTGFPMMSGATVYAPTYAYSYAQPTYQSGYSYPQQYSYYQQPQYTYPQSYSYGYQQPMNYSYYSQSSYSYPTQQYYSAPQTRGSGSDCFTDFVNNVQYCF